PWRGACPALAGCRSGKRNRSHRTFCGTDQGGAKGQDAVTISPWLIAELRALHARRQEQRLKLGMGRVSGDSPVFARWDGKIRSPHWLSKNFAAAMKTLKIGCKLHALRHTHVSQLILTISRRIGHASAAITLDVYGHLFTNTDARAAAIIEA